MELVRIFGKEDAEDGLFAVKYHKDGPDEFDRLFNLWNDTEYVESFCYENEADLVDAFQRPVTVEEAAREIIEEAMVMEEQLFEYYESTRLQEIFRPLFNHEYILSPLQRSKACIVVKMFHRPKLIVYAIRLAPNSFIMSGGAVKLTATMNDRPHLMEELRKLDSVKGWLQQNDIDISQTLNFF
ncbi:hypothetical protein EGT74_13610 [Chitinophaga lutea]|uniref:Uncharacterized protein n=1 Tax=Chitinophaga lutea TaxID=2488634 RepID=A0A3N4PWP6_9BACT|nr:hypothetical protein [Chitinophaga lutea]RPE08100.1 hypothetical protein EGT74_13610 [Chitinophaga lutea]